MDETEQIDLDTTDTTDNTELRRMVAVMLRSGAIPRPWRRTDGDERCQECARINPVWWVQHEIWNKVMHGSKEAIVCPPCFIRHAEAAGVGRRGAWQLYPPSPLD
jgi:hypothetical protein